jgi:hypothetical protein
MKGKEVFLETMEGFTEEMMFQMCSKVIIQSLPDWENNEQWLHSKPEKLERTLFKQQFKKNHINFIS